MGTGKIVCGREILLPHTGEAERSRLETGWMQPFGYSEEYVMYVKGVQLGEVYKLIDERWVSRIYPHLGKEYDTLDEAMLFLEAVAALGM
jgi:hypothetical protein